jgi:uncharacterized repeat protein (TIGR02543 family)
MLKSSSLLLAAAFVSAQASDAFSQCRFHFGSDQSYAKNNPALMQQLDYLTGPWTGQSTTFDLGDYYNLCKSNNKLPVNQAYVIAFAARRDQGLQDCNVSSTDNLCTDGANYIRQNRDKILGIYASYAAGVNQIMGSTTQSIWLMEPDFSQYTLSTQNGGGLTFADAGKLMSDIVSTIKTNCPGAVFSMDISPWNDTTWQKNWFGAIGMDKFDYINTSGGGSRADQTFISDSWSTALPTWKWVYQTFKKPLLADAGYGAGGAGTGYDARWDDVTNLTNRINDGVIGIAQVNPSSDWATTISNNRPKLPLPPSCLSVSTYTLALSSTTNGSIAASPVQPAGGYSSGDVVTITATPNTGYQLSGWTGACSGTGACSVTMDANKTVGATFSAGSGTTNILLNGDFSNGANSWNLGIYGGAATGAVVNGEYVTTPTVAGSACWYFQFTQGNLTLEQGKTYTLSFQARAASSRPINVVVGMSVGPYSRYMGDIDTTLSTTMQTFTKTFTMTAATTTDARVEFNSALSAVQWTLDNVTLVAGTGSSSASIAKYSLTLSGTTNGSIAPSSAQPTGGYDSGTVVAVTATPSTGYQFAGWTGACSGTGACSVTMDANKTVGASFSVIATSTNLLQNGDFSSGATSWNFGVYGGAATGAVVGGEYVTTPTTAGTQSWHFQLTQGNLTLEQDKTYTLSFQARADSARTVEANVGMSADPYTSYMGGFDVSLTTTMQTFTKTFTMTGATTTTARVEFNSGLSAVQWTLDNVTLVAGTAGTPASRALALLGSQVAENRVMVSGREIAFDASGMGKTTLELRSIDGAKVLTLWTGTADGPMAIAADRVPRGIWVATLRGQSATRGRVLNLVR